MLIIDYLDYDIKILLESKYVLPAYYKIKKFSDSWFTTVKDCKRIYEENLFFIRIQTSLHHVAFSI